VNKKSIVGILFLVTLGALIYNGYGSSDSPGKPSGYTPKDAASLYCLKCHGGSYEALADRTAALYGDDGWWNPHRSAHGAYVPCRTCHEEDATAQQKTRCTDKTVKKSDACSYYCHTGGYNPGNPGTLKPDPYPGERAPVK